MIITLEQLKSFAHGQLDVTQEEEGWLCLHRYTPLQEEFYREPKWPRSPLDTTGMRLECVTDASRLSLDYQFKIGTRLYYCFDLYVDGELYTDWGKPDGMPVPETETRSLSFSLPAGKKRLTLWLPQIGRVFLKNITLEDATLLEWTTYSKTYLAIGDSLTHGSAAYHPANTFPARLARAWGVELYNHGMGGDWHDLRNLGQGVPFTPDYITVLLGCNDWYRRTAEVYEAEVGPYYQKLNELYPNTKIAVLTPLWNRDAGENKKMGSLDYARSVIEKEIEKYPNMTLIRGQDLMPEDPSMFVDACHPSDDGFAFVIGRLQPMLEKIFEI